jgi:hypothetical protein
MKQGNYLFVTGMFRSGTTLLARILDVHPEISFASDPYRPFFNHLRSQLAQENNLTDFISPDLPLSSYFCDGPETELMNVIQRSHLKRSITRKQLRKLIFAMAKRALPFSPLVAKRMKELNGKTYAQLYERMMKLIQECYGKQNAKIVGHKEVWCTEFTAPLHRTFPNMRFIFLIRDPRAVCASNNVTKAKYSWLFLIRQWRKLAAMAWLFSTSYETKKLTLMIKYEDLILKPEQTAQKICAFLGVRFQKSMIDGQNFRDGNRKQWLQNSSYGAGTSISRKFENQWKEVLSKEEIRFIEMFCYPDMELFGYERSLKKMAEFGLLDVLNPLVVKQEELSLWIRNLSNDEPIKNLVEMMKEFVRRGILNMPKHALAYLNAALVQAFFIDRKYFDQLHPLIHRQRARRFSQPRKVRYAAV